jgi:hypothetical protein
VTLLQQAADHGDTFALARLVRWAAEVGQQERADVFARRTAERGDQLPVLRLAHEACGGAVTRPDL